MSEWQVCGLCEWSSLGAEGFLGLWEGLVPGRGERQGLAFWEGGGARPLFTPSVNEHLHGLLCKPLSMSACQLLCPQGNVAFPPGSLRPHSLCWAFSIFGASFSSGVPGALTRPCVLSEVISLVCVLPHLPTSELKPQVPDCLLGLMHLGSLPTLKLLPTPLLSICLSLLPTPVCPGSASSSVLTQHSASGSPVLPGRHWSCL